MNQPPLIDTARSCATDPLAGANAWIVTDGRLGMINQCRGLAAVLGVAAEEKTIELKAPWRWLPPLLTPVHLAVVAASGDQLSPPWPDLLIGTGRKSVAPALAVKRASGGRTFCVQVQDPDAAHRRFDLLIAPEHDRLRGANVFTTRGSLHGITTRVLDEARARFAPDLAHLPRPLVAVLLGGHNAVYRMDDAVARRLGEALAALCDAGHGLAITASPRTPASALAAITDALREDLAAARAMLWDGSGANPYLGFLAHADAIVVTADSVNMVSEAAATGKPVHVVELPGGSDKFRRFHDAMMAAGITRRFAGTLEHWSYPIPDDTARAADEIRRRMKRRAA